ncbi:MAG: nucleotide sugar dehydrogenase [Sphingomonadales bacterium]|nr:nucleotide sugar dehydrogenase [Sphingomonadales bacterium]
MSDSLIQGLRQGKQAIAIIGLGYTGWPLAVALSDHFEVRGYDSSTARIELLNKERAGKQKTSTRKPSNEQPPKAQDLPSAGLALSCSEEIIRGAACFIIAVPTPVHKNNAPDLHSLETALLTVGAVLKKGDLVVIESTVYPGCTEEFCIPLLEKISKLKVNIDFGVGYSPERINPGDTIHTLSSVTKLISASSTQWLPVIECIYSSVIEAGLFVCSTIKVAEAAKMTENIQRDVNIALMNQLSALYEKMQIDTSDVWQAAATKWNFLPFRPGLAGGHCISVDPYYLLHQAQQFSFSPTLVAEARRVNESVKSRIVNRVLAHLESVGVSVPHARLLIKGISFKPNVADVRNAKIVEVALELLQMGCQVELSDPIADTAGLQKEYGLSLIDEEKGLYDIVIVAACHADYNTLNEDYFCQRTPALGLIADLSGTFRNTITKRTYWTL